MADKAVCASPPLSVSPLRPYRITAVSSHRLSPDIHFPISISPHLIAYRAFHLRLTSSHILSAHPIPSHPHPHFLPSHPIPTPPIIPSHPYPHRLSSHPIPSHLIPSSHTPLLIPSQPHPISSHLSPTPSHPITPAPSHPLLTLHLVESVKDSARRPQSGIALVRSLTP